MSKPEAAVELLVVETGLHAPRSTSWDTYRQSTGENTSWFVIPDLAGSEVEYRAGSAGDAVARQERRLEALQEQYSDALKDRDPAALSLLENSLFRAGVPISLLVDVFTSEGKYSISGKDLSTLDRQGVQKRLESLVDMRLVERPKTGFAYGYSAATSQGSPVLDQRGVEKRLGSLVDMRLVEQPRTGFAYGYSAKADEESLFSVHPALREILSRRLSAEATLDCHKAILDVLTRRLEPTRDGSYPTDSLRLDLLTEIIYHSVRAKQYRAAWALYVKVVGGYANLGRRLGAYWRGERLCSTFAGGSLASSQLLELPQDARLLCLYDWGRFLLALGRLDDATAAFTLHNQERMEQGNWLYVGLGCAYMCELSILSGDLATGLDAISEALTMIARTGSAGLFRDCLAHRGHVEFLMGHLPLASKDFELNSTRTNWHRHRLPIEWKAFCIARFCRHQVALDFLEAKARLLAGVTGEDFYKNIGELATAEISLENQIQGDWEHRIRSTYELALLNDAREILCIASLVPARHFMALIDCGNPSGCDPRYSLESGGGLIIARSVDTAFSISNCFYVERTSISSVDVPGPLNLMLKWRWTALYLDLRMSTPPRPLPTQLHLTCVGFLGRRVVGLLCWQLPTTGARINGGRHEQGGPYQRLSCSALHKHLASLRMLPTSCRRVLQRHLIRPRIN